jgi:uncharacterized protein (TIGR03435 family)
MKIVLLTSALAVCLFAQSEKTGFEAASIHAVAPGEQCGSSMIGPMPGGGLRVECLSLKSIITWAYEVQNYQVSGGPEWAESLHWMILATAPAPVDPSAPVEYQKMSDAQRKSSMDLVKARLQTLLADRFQLTLRHESREQTVYALTVAKGGSKLREAADQTKSGSLMRGRGRVESKGFVLDGLAQSLGVDLQRPVLNHTGLTARYEFKLEWTPDSPDHTDSVGPTLFTAIQEQLGLKLEAQKAPVETLVIESAAKPEN